MPSDPMTSLQMREEELKTLAREGLTKPPVQIEPEPPEEEEPSDG